jgi:BirA family biotin operon repressor/biotin-[acetyl-CoA-carboxylase] ligase
MDYMQRMLADLSLGGMRYFDQVDSTNDEAERWIRAGAPDLALVVANEQTNGRGRLGRRWFTPPDSALAFSVVLRWFGQSLPDVHKQISRLTALGALAVGDALQEMYLLGSEIKWPNDVLVGGRKISGVLSEAQWDGDQLTAAVLGIGINIALSSLELPEDEQGFPVTCVEQALVEKQGRVAAPVDRWLLLRSVLQKLLVWRPLLNSVVFIRAWDSRLAFRGQWVRVYLNTPEHETEDAATIVEGKIQGLTSEGALQLLDRQGRLIKLQAGELRLRPLEM